MTWITILVSIMLWFCYLVTGLICFYSFFYWRTLDSTEKGLTWVCGAIFICSGLIIITTSVVPF